MRPHARCSTSVHIPTPLRWPKTAEYCRQQDMGDAELQPSPEEYPFATGLQESPTSADWWGSLGWQWFDWDMEQLAYLFMTLLIQAGAECNYGVAAVWWHPTQSKVNIHLTLKELEDHDLSNGPLAVLVQVFSNSSFWIHPDPPFIGLKIHNDPQWLECMAPPSKLRVRQLLTDEKGLRICPRELINGFKHKKHQVGPEQLWQLPPDNHNPPMMEYFMLSTGKSEGVTPSLTPGHCSSTPEELPPVDQDMVMASGDGDGGQGNEELARLAATVAEDTIPAATCKLSPPFATLMKTYNPPSGTNSSRSKPANGRCMSWGEHRRRLSSRTTRPWRRLASRSTMWRNRRGSYVNTWVGKSGLRVSSGSSAICLKHPWWRKRQSFKWKFPIGDSSTGNKSMKSPKRALPTTYRRWAKLLGRPHLPWFYS